MILEFLREFQTNLRTLHRKSREINERSSFKSQSVKLSNPLHSIRQPRNNRKHYNPKKAKIQFKLYDNSISTDRALADDKNLLNFHDLYPPMDHLATIPTKYIYNKT